MLEKGKGLVLGKLRTIQLVEADLYLIIRVFLGLRNTNKIESSKRISKFNFGSRKNYLIDEAILKKRLIYDTSIWTEEPTVYLITDLSTYYN